MNPDHTLFLICAGFEAAKILLPVLVIGYITLKLN